MFIWVYSFTLQVTMLRSENYRM